MLLPPSGSVSDSGSVFYSDSGSDSGSFSDSNSSSVFYSDSGSDAYSFSDSNSCSDSLILFLVLILL